MAKDVTSKKKKKAEMATSGVKQAFTALDVFIYAFLLLLAIICFYPFLNVIAYSFSGYNAVLSQSVSWRPVDFCLDAYYKILKNKEIWQAMLATVLITVEGTALSIVLTTAAAYALSRPNLPGRRIFAGLMLFTMYFGGGIIPTFMVVKSVGLIDTLASVYVPVCVSVYNFIIMRSFFREIPESLQEAALIDGATDMQVLFKIVLPLSVPIIATIGLFYAVTYWNDYFNALLYISDSSKFTLQLRLRALLVGNQFASGDASSDGVEVMQQSLRMASVAVATVPILIVYPWLQKYFVKGMMLGSVKG